MPENPVKLHESVRYGTIPKRKRRFGRLAYPWLTIVAKEVEQLTIAGHKVPVTNPEKLYFSKQAKVTKLELVRYYLSVAPGLILSKPRALSGASQPAPRSIPEMRGELPR